VRKYLAQLMNMISGTHYGHSHSLHPFPSNLRDPFSPSKRAVHVMLLRSSLCAVSIQSYLVFHSAPKKRKASTTQAA
jgi:hypothetical protein